MAPSTIVYEGNVRNAVRRISGIGFWNNHGGWSYFIHRFHRNNKCNNKFKKQLTNN